ncbi:MAG: ABC transporter ATP-binding protein [Roseiflexaceae bacterium]|nr:ABC transporter ATP-binding protein [Roseiflexaceae bacterium]
MAELAIHNLTKRFGKVTAVRDMNLTIADREFLVLLGPSGAGKTTTLRCVAGVEKPDVGDIRFDGQAVTTVSPAERDIAFVFQTYALYPRKTAFENIAFPLEARRLAPTEIEHTVREVAKKLRIEHLLQRRPGQLSGGEQQRVALGRAMVRKPRAFLMDEPLTNLDFKLRVEMRGELKRIHFELKTTLLYVTNDQTEAMSLADRIAVLNSGVLQQVDTPEAIYERPVNQFVAAFVGNPRMNFLECGLRADGGPQLIATDGSWSLPIPGELWDRVHTTIGGGRLILGVRPEDIALSAEPLPSSIPGKIYVIEPLGDRTIIDLAIGGAQVRVRVPPTSTDVLGAQLWCSFDTQRIHLFHPETGQRI